MENEEILEFVSFRALTNDEGGDERDSSPILLSSDLKRYRQKSARRWTANAVMVAKTSPDRLLFSPQHVLI